MKNSRFRHRRHLLLFGAFAAGALFVAGEVGVRATTDSPKHVSVEIKKSALDTVLKSALNFANEEAGSFVIRPGVSFGDKSKPGKIGITVPVNDGSVQQVAKTLNELFGIDVSKGIPLKIRYGGRSFDGGIKLSIQTGDEGVRYELKQRNLKTIDIDARLTVNQFEAVIQRLLFQIDVAPRPWLAFDGVALKLARNAKATLKATFRVKFKTSARRDGGVVLNDQVAAIEVLNAGLVEKPKLKLSFKTISMSEIQVGPNHAGLALDLPTVSRRVQLESAGIAAEISNALAKYVADNLQVKLNGLMAGKHVPLSFWKEFQPESLSRFDQGSSLDGGAMVSGLKGIWSQLKGFVSKVTVGVQVASMNLYGSGSEQSIHVDLKPELLIGGLDVNADPAADINLARELGFVHRFAPEPVIGHSLQERPLGTPDFSGFHSRAGASQGFFPTFGADNKRPNFAIALSESYLNGLLKLAARLGVLQQIFANYVHNPGVYLGSARSRVADNDALQIHFRNGKVYLVANIDLNLDSRAAIQGDLTTRIGLWLERTLPGTSGFIRFPLEFETELSVVNDANGSQLEIRLHSPIRGYSALYNSFSYFSNLDRATGVVHDKIMKSLRDSFVPLSDWNVRSERTAFEPIRVSLNPYLSRLPVRVTPTAVEIQDSGYIVLQGVVDGVKGK